MTTGRDIAAEHGPVGYALAVAARAQRRVLQEHLAALGLHLGQELVVVDLHCHPGSTQAELVERIGIEQPTIAKTVARMERAGFVDRVSDDRDRRLVRLSLTARGEGAVGRIQAAWAAADAASSRGLTDGERVTLTRLLRKFAGPTVSGRGGELAEEDPMRVNLRKQAQRRRQPTGRSE